MPARPARPVLPQHRVTAVLVTHDGARWLPDVLAAVHGQVRPAERLVAVDTGSVDSTTSVLAAHIHPDDIVAMPRTAGFGAAVAAGLAHVGELGPRPDPEPYRPFPTGPEDLLADDDDLDPIEVDEDLPAPSAGADWVWLLHDDSAPEPDALLRMLELAETSPSVALIGPKVRDWDDPRLLVEVGLTIDHAGRRETGLERHEFDQGQHDSVRDVLAVGTAGCLVRRDVWDTLGGLDRRLPIFRDDIDLGWRVNAAGHRVVVAPAARVRHVRAAASGRRRVRCAVGRTALVDRRHSLAVMLANLPLPSLLLAVPRLVIGALLRAVGFLLTRQVHAATDEISSLWWNFVRTPQLLRARAARRRHRKVGQRELRHLFAGRTARLRGYLEATGDWLSGGAAETSTIGVDQSADDDNLVVPSRGSRAVAVLTRPAVLMTAALVVLSVVAARDLLGAGRLVGGHLLPAPQSATELWRTYAAPWHDVGGGTSAEAPAWVAVLAGLATLLFGKAWLVVDVLMLLAVPLAALSAYAAARRVTPSRLQRVWAGVAYALLPPVTGAVAAGHLDAVVAAIMVPLMLSACYRAVSQDPAVGGWRHAFVAGLSISIGAAFVPQLWPLAVLVTLIALVGVSGATDTRPGVRRRGAVVRRTAAWLLTALTPLAVLFPWSLSLVRRPELFVSGLTTGSADEPLRGLDALLLRPGGPSLPPMWLTAGLLLAAAVGLLRSGRRGSVAVGCWTVVIAALAVAVATTRADDLAGWPGPAMCVAAAGLVASALVAAQGVRRTFARFSFGWRQPAAVLVVAAAVAGPIAAAGLWGYRGADDPVERRPVLAVPSHIAAKADREPGLRALWLRPGRTGVVDYTVTGLRGGGPLDEQVHPSAALRTRLDELVGDLAAPRGSDAAQALATHAVRYVVVPKPVPRALSTALDAQPALTRERVERASRVLLWRALAPSARLTLVSGPTVAEASTLRGPSLDAVRSAPPAELTPDARGRVTIPAGPPGRLLVLSEPADRLWTARAGGAALERTTAWRWAQAFEVPAEETVVTVAARTSGRRLGLAAQAALLLVVCVLAAPAIRRSEDAADIVDTQAEEPRVLETAGAGA